MHDATHLLFLKNFEGEPLFKNQLDLVHQLLRHSHSPYYIPDEQKEELAKAQNRLKAYLSQLLSQQVNRTITDKFISGLRILVQNRLRNSSYNAEEILQEIVQNLQARNKLTAKSDEKNNVVDQISSELSSAKYISIITAKPLEMILDFESKSFSFEKFLLYDLAESLNRPGFQIRHYRFNFPMESFCDRFWKGLKKFVRFYINRKALHQSLRQSLMVNYKIEPALIESFSDKIDSHAYFELVADQVLFQLNRERKIIVFLLEAPVYTMPIIAINPDEPKAAKLYSLMDTGNQNIFLHRYSQEDFTLWRLFVWDKLKTNMTTKSIPYQV